MKTWVMRHAANGPDFELTPDGIAACQELGPKLPELYGPRLGSIAIGPSYRNYDTAVHLGFPMSGIVGYSSLDDIKLDMPWQDVKQALTERDPQIIEPCLAWATEFLKKPPPFHWICTHQKNMVGLALELGLELPKPVPDFLDVWVMDIPRL